MTASSTPDGEPHLTSESEPGWRPSDGALGEGADTVAGEVADLATTGSTPALKRTRRSATLTEKEIVDAALRVIRESGLESLSMRRLSRELGVSAMAAYYYVANKEELLDLVAAQAFADIEAPSAASGLSWHVRLRMLIDRIDIELRHHRGIGDVLLDRMQSTQRHVMRAMMDVLADAGFDDRNVVMAYAMVHTYLFGRYRVTMSAPPTSPAGSEPSSTDVISRVSVTVASLRGRDYYDFGIDTIIAGLRAQLRAQRTRDGAALKGAPDLTSHDQPHHR